LPFTSPKRQIDATFLYNTDPYFQSRPEIYPGFILQVESKPAIPSHSKFERSVLCFVDLSKTGVEQASAGSNGAAKARFQPTLTYIH
jgi:hypothetical protein